MADELSAVQDFQAVTLPLHRDLGRIEGKLSAVEGRLGAMEARVLRNETITEEGFRLAANEREKSAEVIETKVDNIEKTLGDKIDGVQKAVADMALKQAAKDGRSSGGQRMLWTVGSIAFAGGTLLASIMQIFWHH
ncbi:MAG TPA: hypothetical protein VKR31_00960 [Rhizomicrobium sp.]|nr:hypothetical protein [Rhizomicrobium sp.]